jgi:WD40 repeat protein
VGAKKEQVMLPGAPGGVGCVAFTPDGQRLVAGTGSWGAFGEVWLWDLPARRVQTIFKGHPNIVTRLALSPDGRRLASAGGDVDVRVWDVSPGN